MAFFVYDEGAFRYLGKPKVPDVAHSGPQNPAKIQASVRAAKLIYAVRPIYPPEAKVAGVQGVVVLHAMIGRDGAIHKLSYVRGPEPLSRAAIDAVKYWRYSPTMLNGQPVDVDTCITVTFNLGSGR